MIIEVAEILVHTHSPHTLIFMFIAQASYNLQAFLFQIPFTF